MTVALPLPLRRVTERQPLPAWQGIRGVETDGVYLACGHYILIPKYAGLLTSEVGCGECGIDEELAAMADGN